MDKLFAGFPQAGDHHKHHGKQNSKDKYGACCQAHRAGQLCWSFAAHLIPATFQRPKDYVDQKSNCAADQKRGEQRKHLAEKPQNGVKVYQCPCEYDQQHQCAGNIANDRLVWPLTSLRSGILVFVTGCVLRFFLRVFPSRQYGKPFKSESTCAELYTHTMQES